MLLNRSLSITEKLLGKDHPESMETMNNLDSLFCQGQDRRR
ncbi:MAG: tetratricopeptide repeat protein [Betaproteobacteria bacterium]|nr:tetratricopeptide repeat protein [Betaproteobacteria bacterium]